MAEVTYNIANVSFLSRHSWSPSLSLQTGNKKKMQTMSTMQKMQNLAHFRCYLDNRTLEPNSPSGPLGPPAACKENSRMHTVRSFLKKQKEPIGEIKGLLTLQSKEQH